MVMLILWACVICAFLGVAIATAANAVFQRCDRELQLARRFPGGVDLDALAARAGRAARFRRFGGVLTFIAVTVGGPLAEWEGWQRGMLTDEGFVGMLLLHALSVVVAIWVARKRGHY